MPNIPDEWFVSGEAALGGQGALTKNGPVGGSGTNLTTVAFVVVEAVGRFRVNALGAGIVSAYLEVVDLNGPTVKYQKPLTIDMGAGGEAEVSITDPIPITPSWGCQVRFNAGLAGVSQFVSMRGYAI